MKQTLIVSDPKILSGKPIISGTRISVELIMDRVASGMSIREILEDYPHLTTKQVQAALSYAKNLVINKSLRSKMDNLQSTIIYTHEISRR